MYYAINHVISTNMMLQQYTEDGRHAHENYTFFG